MYVKWVSANSVIEAHLRATGDKEVIDADDMKAIVSDTVDRMVDAEVWTYGMVLLDVKGYQTELPANFRTPDAVAYRLHPYNRYSRQEIVNHFKTHGLEKDCNLEISLVCPKCTEIECNCHSPLVEVDVDQVWAMSHPERFAAHMKHFIGYWNNDAPRGHDSKFKLMFPNHNNLRNGNFYLGECAGVHYDCDIHYNVDNGMMIVPFKEGQILMGYKGIQLDADGWRMVPDNPLARKAINYAIEEVAALKDYRKKKDRQELVYWQNMEAKANQFIGKARNELNTPDVDKWIEQLKNHHTKLLPYWNWEANLNRNQRDQYNPPGATFTHRGN